MVTGTDLALQSIPGLMDVCAFNVTSKLVVWDAASEKWQQDHVTFGGISIAIGNSPLPYLVVRAEGIDMNEECEQYCRLASATASGTMGGRRRRRPNTGRDGLGSSWCSRGTGSGPVQVAHDGGHVKALRSSVGAGSVLETYGLGGIFEGLSASRRKAP